MAAVTVDVLEPLHPEEADRERARCALRFGESLPRGVQEPVAILQPRERVGPAPIAHHADALGASANAREQLFREERAGDPVVRARFERRDARLGRRVPSTRSTAGAAIRGPANEPAHVESAPSAEVATTISACG